MQCSAYVWHASDVNACCDNDGATLLLLLLLLPHRYADKHWLKKFLRGNADDSKFDGIVDRLGAALADVQFGLQLDGALQNVLVGENKKQKDPPFPPKVPRHIIQTGIFS